MGTFASSWGRGSKVYTAASANVVAGTLNSGTVASIQTFNDGQVLDVQEVAAAPGWNIVAGFTGIGNFTGVMVNMWYKGSANHQISVQVYNNTTSAWDTIYRGTDEYALTQLKLPLIQTSPYVAGSHVVTVRLYHDTSGNIAHNIVVDYVALYSDY